MSDLAQCVDASVGAARAVHDDSFLGDFARGVVDGALNRRDAGLELPAMKIGSVVGDCNFDISHRPIHRKPVRAKIFA